MAIFYYLAFWIFFPITNALLGYMCGLENNNVTRIDLTEVKECESIIDSPISESLNIQVIQTKNYLEVNYKACLITITRTVYNCNWDQEVSQIADGHFEYILELGVEKCKSAHIDRSLKLFNGLFTGLQINVTKTYPMTFAGKLDQSGWCENTQYFSDIGGKFNNVFVTGYITIRLESGKGQLVLFEDRFQIPSLGITCSGNSEYCLDSIKGEVIWNHPDKDCSTGTVDVLYEGRATKMSSTDKLGNTNEMLMVREGSHIFALRLMKQARFCGQIIYKTEHNRIMVSTNNNDGVGYLFRSSDISPHNIDLTAYINSKFLYVTLNLYQSIDNLYTALLNQACETRKLVLENRLSLAKLDPMFISQLIGKTQGVYGRVVGEVLYIIECTPVPVTIRSDSKCYQELPVYLSNNRSAFLSPRTRIITYMGEEIDCVSVIPPMYKMGNQWITRTPVGVLSQHPDTLNPNLEKTWEMIPSLSISSGGLYAAEELEKLQRAMMFPSMRSAISSDITDKVVNSDGEISYAGMFSTQDLNSLTDTIGKKVSWFFNILGHWTSIVIGIFMFLKLISYVISVCINCKTINTVNTDKKRSRVFYIFSLLDALTSLFTWLPNKRPTKRNEDIESGALIPLQETKEKLDQPQTSTNTMYPPPDYSAHIGPSQEALARSGILSNY